MNYCDLVGGEKIARQICPTTGKQCLSRRAAGELLNEIKKHKRTSGRKNIPKRKYLCEFCGCYHLTHAADEKSKRKRFRLVYGD